MSKGPLGYGRYQDDPNHIGCPRAKSDMTPCVARDGKIACADDGTCVGCWAHPAELLMELVHDITAPQIASPLAAAEGDAPVATRRPSSLRAATDNRQEGT